MRPMLTRRLDQYTHTYTHNRRQSIDIVQSIIVCYSVMISLIALDWCACISYCFSLFLSLSPFGAYEGSRVSHSDGNERSAREEQEVKRKKNALISSRTPKPFGKVVECVARAHTVLSFVVKLVCHSVTFFSSSYVNLLLLLVAAGPSAITSMYLPLRSPSAIVSDRS